MCQDCERERQQAEARKSPGGGMTTESLKDVVSASSRDFSRGYMAGRRDGSDPVEEVFEYHQPTLEQVARMREMREAAKFLVKCIIRNAPGCADRSAAIRKVREAIMTANVAVALDGAKEVR